MDTDSYSSIQDEDKIESKGESRNINKRPRPKMSLDSLSAFEQKKIIDSPLSIKACKIEGVLPKDLLYRPVSYYQDQCQDPQMAELKYRIHEAKRMKNIELVSETRMRLLQQQKTITPGMAYKQDNIFKSKFLAKTYGAHVSSPSKGNMEIKTADSFTRQIGAHSTNEVTPINSRFLSSRYSPGASQTSARKFWRSYTRTDNMISNALTRDNHALQQKISSVALDFSKDLNQFKYFVRSQIVKGQKTELFHDQINKYNSFKQDRFQSLEKEAKTKSDNFIQEKISKEQKTHKKILKEKKLFKKEIQRKEYYTMSDLTKQLMKKDRVQSAKSQNDMKRLEIYQKSEDLTNLYLDQLKIKLMNKEEKLQQTQEKLKEEREQWTQKFRVLQQKGEKARIRQKLTDEQKFSHDVKQAHLMYLYRDFEQKETKAKMQKSQTVSRLNSANTAKQERVKKAYLNFENQIQQRSEFLQLQESLTETYIQKIIRQREESIKKKQDLVQIKKEVATSNKRTLERQKTYEQKELEKKIKLHFDAYRETESIKSNLEQQRLKFQFDLEQRKEEIRETLFRMQVWNCWDERILNLVLKRPIGTSIDTVVREFAASQKSSMSMTKSIHSQYVEHGAQI